MIDKKYGNSHYWCFIPEGWSGKEIAIWKGPEDSASIIARVSDKYEARIIIDALLHYKVDESGQLNKKELAFLEFVCSNCNEPYATMASNAILWRDKMVYNELKNKFPTIYE